MNLRLKPLAPSLGAVLAILFVSSLLQSCARVVVKDAEFCADGGELGGVCFNTLSDANRDIPQPAWDEERFGMICTKPDNFAHWKATIMKLCRDSHLCSYEVKKEIDAFVAKVDTIAAKARRGGRRDTRR